MTDAPSTTAGRPGGGTAQSSPAPSSPAQTVEQPMQIRYSPDELARLLATEAEQEAGTWLRPTAQQAEVIQAPLTPRLVVAGAGSGKTATMADRVVWLVANGLVRPDQVLGVTFTRKAAGELAHRINGRLERLLAVPGFEIPGFEGTAEELGRAAVSTYHSYAGALVRDHGLRIGVEPGAVQITDADAYRMMRQIAEDADVDLQEGAPALSTLVSGALGLAGDMAEHLVEPDAVRDYLAAEIAHGASLPPTRAGAARNKEAGELLFSLRARLLMAHMVEAYTAAKEEAEVMDFGDLLRHAARIAADVPEVGHIERDRYRVVLLDEFQDTSHAQMTIFAGLFGASSGEGVGHCVTAVGDPHQSIYGFRGASAGQLFDFPHRFPARDEDARQAPGADPAAADGEAQTGEGAVVGRLRPADVSHLTTAWRNDESILALANRIVAPMAQPETDTVQVQPLQSRPGASAGEVRLDEYVTGEEEAADLVARMQRLADDAGDGPVPSRAILCRGRAQFGPVIDALEAAGAPYQVLGLNGLLSLPEVAEVLAVLHVVAEPGRSDHLVRWLSGPRWRIGPADLALLKERARFVARLRTRQSDEEAARLEDTSPEEDADTAVLLEALDDLPRESSRWTGRDGRTFSAEGLRRLTAARDMLRRLARRTDMDPAEMIGEVERATGLDVELALRPGPSAVAARRHLNAFIDTARQFGRRAVGRTVDLAGFLAWVESAAEHEMGLGIENAEPDPRAISVLTAHASKGLEWDVVAVPGLVRGAFPSTRADRWMALGAGALPWPLRGDRNALPQWDHSWAENDRDWVQSSGTVKAKAALELLGSRPDFATLLTEHALRDERRLAYVAFTRARSRLWLSTCQWKGTNKTPVEVSEFFAEAAELAEDGPTPVAGVGWGTRLTDQQRTDANPTAGRMRAALWPFDPLEGPIAYDVDPDDPEDREAWTELPRRSRGRRAAVEAAAAAVRGADPADLDLDSALGAQLEWAVLRERALQDASGEVALPQHLSVSLYGELAKDPEAVAEQLRRPMPRPPAHAARRGTAFHAWLEDRFEATGMLDIDDPDDAADQWMDDALDLEPMQQWFLSSRWADRIPAQVEAPLETTVAGVTLRGRVDAVYRSGGDPADPFDPQAQWELVDWKTGRVPTGRDLENKALQLAVYRLAFSRLHGIPLENIGASFVYIAHGEERTMEALPGEEELERILREALGSP
ncbi:ATP-dependent DNA helicase [Micrococcus sp. HMSC067E09]|uniref:ATP-dependent DNA helicase n=1 Tax=Micrococcus sp. HMSC067E09 TaxID=1739367 RepID=UPI001FEE6414|nr:ATP-dependent DNA helicase [Micrococcus sp. HMSC067E09]